MPTPLPWSVFFGVVTTFVMLFLFRVGRRWRHEAIPPTCKRCGYDVSHRPADGHRCSECGADLDQPGAIITARRRAAWWLVWPAALFCVCCAMVTVGEAVRYPWFKLYLARAPISWIISHAKARPDSSGDEYREAWHLRKDTPAFVDHLLDLRDSGAMAEGSRWDEVLNLRMLEASIDYKSNLSRVVWERRRSQRDQEEKAQVTQAPADASGVKLDARLGRYIASVLARPVKFELLSPPRVGSEVAVRLTPTKLPSWMSHTTHVTTTVGICFDAPAEIHRGRFESDGWLDDVIEKRAMSWQYVGGNIAPGPHTLHWVLLREPEKMWAGDPDLNPELTKGIELPEPQVLRGQIDVNVLPADKPATTTSTTRP